MLKTIIKYFVLVIVGIISAFFLLEIALRLAGTGVKRSHRVHQEFLLQRSDEGLVILCLGESTTYRQYPVQLQRMFDDRHGKAAVNVIDAGIPGTTISDITKNLRSNLEKFNPDVVIVMAGINDYADVIARNFPQSRFARLLWHNFKTFRLLSLIRSHLSFICESRVLGGKSDDNFTFTSDYVCWSIAPHREYMYEASTLMSAGRFAEAYTIFIKALEIKPDCRHALRNSMLLTSDGKKQRDIALYAVNNFEGDLSQYYFILVTRSVDIDEAVYYARRLFGQQVITARKIDAVRRIQNRWYNYLSQDKMEAILRTLLEEIELSPEWVYSLEAVSLLEKGELSKANRFFDMAKNIRMEFGSKAINKYYKEIARQIVEFGAVPVFMQYPMRSVVELKSRLAQSPYFNDIIFISNEQNFRQAVAKYGYSAIFWDQFAGDFGHAFEFGNEILAENVYINLKNILFREQLN